MKHDILVIIIFYLEHKILGCNALLEGSASKTATTEGKELLKILNENIKDMKKDLHNVIQQLNLTQYNIPNEIGVHEEAITGKHTVENTLSNDKRREEEIVDEKKKTKPLKEGAKRLAKAACQCVCSVTKAVSNVVKTCYGKLRSLCCKRKGINTVKQDAQNIGESLDFGLY